MKHFFSCLPATPCLLALAALLLAGPALAQTPATFAPVVSYSTGAGSRPGGPAGIVVVDVNGDGKLDLLTAHYGNGTAGVLLGTGTGTFGTVTSYSTGAGGQTAGIAVADVNGDGKLDLLTVSVGLNTAGVLLGTGTGTFGAVTSYSTGPSSQPNKVVAADVNGDGKPDLLTANLQTNAVGVLLNTGTGTFGAVAAYSTGANSWPESIAVADVNGDGKLDVLTANVNTNTAGVLLGTGTGTFGAETAYITGAGSGPADVVVADVNGDSKPDLLTVNVNLSTVTVLLGTGTGTFGAATTYSAGTNNGPGGMALADVNGDGKLDALIANQSNSIGVLLGTGTGTFGAVTTYSTGAGSRPITVVAADVNGDGKLDLLTANNDNSTVGVLLNTTTVLATHASAAPGQPLVALYPNPTLGQPLTLALANLPAEVRQVQATLLDALGRPVGQATLPAALGAARAELPTGGLASGLYLLRLRAQDGQGAAVGSLPTQRLAVE